MARLHPYPPRLAALLQSFPGPGRFHRWMFQVSLHLRHYHSRDWTLAFLRECAKDMDRSVPDLEIERTVHKAYALEPEAHHASTVSWMEHDPRRVDRVRATTKPLFALSDIGLSPRDVLPLLFDPGELVCSARFTPTPVTEPLEDLIRHADGQAFIVPNPMTAAAGITKDGRPSPRCLGNTGPRRYLVIENDRHDKATQAVLLSHLAAIAPLALAVDSGGKSLHGWFCVAGTPEPGVRLLMHYACTLGADPHTWTRCQWVRMPGGLRDRSIRQPVLYFNQEVLSCPAP